VGAVPLPGIFFATTTPPSTPWVTEQAFVRVYNPYLQFIYMRNAYHFYSPEPGPASVLVCLLKTETGTDDNGQKQYTTKWVVLPKRPADVKDPLGLTYYRRLSITEQLARASAGLIQSTNAAEKNEMLPRRQAVSHLIPMHPVEEPGVPVPAAAAGGGTLRVTFLRVAHHPGERRPGGGREDDGEDVPAGAPDDGGGGVHQRPRPHRGGTQPVLPTTYRPFFLASSGTCPTRTSRGRRGSSC
jgi:hypothetical protein